MAVSLQDMYVQLLLDLVRDENYPNPAHLDRIEASVANADQLSDYVDLLLERVGATRHPSSDLLNRIERLAAAQQKGRRRAAARESRERG